MSASVKTKITVPADTVFDFAGDGLIGDVGKLCVNPGAGLTFNDDGLLVLDLKDSGGLSLIHQALSINPCEVSSAIAGWGLCVKDCKLALDFCPVIGVGLTVGEDKKLDVDVVSLAGTGLSDNNGQLCLDEEFVTDFVTGVSQAVIDDDMTADQNLTLVLPYTVATDFSYQPNGYGYNSVLQVAQSTSTLTIFRSQAGIVVGIVPGEVVTITQNFDLVASGMANTVAERKDTPCCPNFYVK